MLVWESMNNFLKILSKRNLCPVKIFKSNNVNEWAGSRSNTSIEIVFNYYGKNQIFVVSIFLFELRQIYEFTNQETIGLKIHIFVTAV